VKHRWYLSALLITVMGAVAWSDEKADKAELYARLAAGPPGVSKVEMEKERAGRIRSLLVVGRARISTVLGKEKGIQDAQDKAIINAKSRYLQWLKEEASVHQGAEAETVIITEGSEEGGKEALKEYGKSIDKTTTKYESVAKGLVSGLQVVYYDQDGEAKTYTVIMKWTDRKPAAKDKGRDKEATPPKKDKTIPSKKGIIDD
jgi:hypothetical protein